MQLKEKEASKPFLLIRDNKNKLFFLIVQLKEKEASKPFLLITETIKTNYFHNLSPNNYSVGNSFLYIDVLLPHCL